MMTRPFGMIAVVLVLAAVSLGSETAIAQKSGGILRITHMDNPPSASIHEEATISTVMPFMSVFNNLVVFDPETRQNRPEAIVPDLAESWAWGNEGKTLTFKLRPGVKWHDGTPFTSADVKCTWDGLIGKNEARLRKNPRKPWYLNLQDVTVQGDQEVTFHLQNPQASFLTMLAGAFSPVYPCHVNAATMRTKPIGTGPFKFVEFKQNQGMKLTKNPDYWKKGVPYLDGIEFSIIPNRSTMVLAFVAGKFDMTFTSILTVPVMRELKAQAPQAVCEMLPTNTQANLLVNREKPPFDDAKIRRVLSLTLDRKAFIDILSEGQGEVGGAMLPPPAGVWGMPKEALSNVAGYSPDVERSRDEARKIMRDLGYGPDKPLKIKVSTRNIPSYRDPAVILIDHLKQVYIEGELEPLDTPVWYARMLRRDYSIGMNVQGVGIDDPDVVFFETFSCGSERNYTQYCNPELEKLFHKQSQMTDFEKRRALVWEIDQKLQEDGARPVIAHGRGGTCWQPYVKGVNIAVNTIYNHWRFERVWIDR